MKKIDNYGKPSKKGDIKLSKLIEILKNSRHSDKEDAFVTFWLTLPNGKEVDLSSAVRIGEFDLISEVTLSFEIADYEDDVINMLEEMYEKNN